MGLFGGGVRHEGFGFRAEGLRLRIQSVGNAALKCAAWGLILESIEGKGLWGWSWEVGFRIWGLEFRFRVEGLAALVAKHYTLLVLKSPQGTRL